MFFLDLFSNQCSAWCIEWKGRIFFFLFLFDWPSLVKAIYMGDIIFNPHLQVSRRGSMTTNQGNSYN
jgi:hypothetical protein